MRIVVLAGEPAFRLGFRILMEEEDDFSVVAEAADARSGLRVVDFEKPDLVAVEIGLPGMSGIHVTRELTQRALPPRILLLGSWLCERDVLDGFAAGARGFALKSDSAESLRLAVARVGAGRSHVSQEMRGLSAEAILEQLRARSASMPDVLSPLSVRERAVLHLVLKGWRNRDIARELCISIKTVDTHRTHINRKLRCSGTADLIRFGAENRLLHHEAPPAGGAVDPVALYDLTGRGGGDELVSR